MLEGEEVDWEVRGVVVEDVLEVVLLPAELVVLGGTEVLLDDDDDEEEEEVGVDTGLVETGDEVVEGTGVGDVGVVLVGEEEGDAEGVGVGTVLQSNGLAQKIAPDTTERTVGSLKVLEYK